jgi:hypothetical protein
MVIPRHDELPCLARKRDAQTARAGTSFSRSAPRLQAIEGDLILKRSARNPGAKVYLVSVVLLLFVLPAASIGIEALYAGGAGSANMMLFVGKWFVFWGVGVRLFIAGARQIVQPQFTAMEIFEVKDRAVLPIVREVGFGNLAMGSLGLASLALPDFRISAAVVGGLYYGFAGVGHVVRGDKSFNAWTALISDLAFFVLLALMVAGRAF